MKINKIAIILSSLLLSSSVLLAEDKITTEVPEFIENYESINFSAQFTNNKIGFESKRLGEETYTGSGIDVSVSFMKNNKDRWNIGLNFLNEENISFSTFEESTISFLIPHIGYDFIYTNLDTDTSLIFGPEMNILIGSYSERYLNLSNGDKIEDISSTLGFGVNFKLGFKQQFSPNLDFEMSYSIGTTFSDNSLIDTGTISTFKSGLNYKF